MEGLKWSEHPKRWEFRCPACKIIQKEAHGILYTYEANKKEWLGRCDSCGAIALVTITRAEEKITVTAYGAVKEK